MFYLAAESSELLNQWIVQIYRASKHIKNMAPAHRTSLAEFVALWDAPLVLASAPDVGAWKDKQTVSVPAICQSILAESTARARCTITEGTSAAAQAVAAASGWFATATG